MTDLFPLSTYSTLWRLLVIYRDLIEQLTEHYATMAMNPGSIDHARYAVKKLRDDESGLFKDLPELVKQRIEEKKHAQTLEVQTTPDHP